MAITYRTLDDIPNEIVASAKCITVLNEEFVDNNTYFIVWLCPNSNSIIITQKMSFDMFKKYLLATLDAS